MSSASFAITADEVSSLLTSVNCGNAMFTMLVFDWLLCLDQEIALVWNWKTRRTVAPLVYILARYMPIIQYGISVASIFPMSLLSCKAVNWVQLISEALSLFAPAVFSAMRTYALSGTNVYLAIITFALSIVPIITNLVNDLKFESSQILPRPFNCSGTDQISQQLEFDFTIINRACLISADLLVIAVTGIYTYRSYKVQKSLKFGSSLGSIMMYSGSLYFVVLASLNVLDMVLTVLQINETVLNTSNYVTIFLEPISYILICHFLFNLRQVDHNIVDPSLPSNQDVDMSVHFARHSVVDTLPAFIGPFGEPVHTSSTIDPDLDVKGDSSELVQNDGAEADEEVAEVSRV